MLNDSLKLGRELMLLNWFSNMGNHTELPDSVSVFEDQDTAFDIWAAESPVREAEWNALEKRLRGNAEWEFRSNRIYENTLNMLMNNKRFIEIAKNDLGIEPNEFYEELPILGYYGEKLLGENGYFSKQIPFYKKGHLVSLNDGVITVF